MATNDFKPFAVGVSANVISQTTYAANGALLDNGFQIGIADPQVLNKVWRQSSIMSAVLGAFIAAQTGANVVDDGTTATLVTNLTNAVKGSAASLLGTVAAENIGQGLEDDGAGNLRVKVADNTIRRTNAGIATAAPITVVSANLALTTAHNNNLLRVVGAAVTLTAPASSTLGNGYALTVRADNGPVTFTPNAADKVNGATAGAQFTILSGQSLELITDGAGNWYSLLQTTPQGAFSPLYITTSQTLGAGTYWVDTRAGAITITLAGSPPTGTVLEFSDAAGTWDAFPLTLARNGATILGVPSDFVCDLAGETLKIWFNGSDWRLF